MHDSLSIISRRRLLMGGLAAGVAGLFVPGVFAEHLDATPSLTEGPFYPYHNIPLDTDNDLILVGDSTTPAIGTIAHLGGRLLDENENPIKDATIEIWQCDANGVYIAEGNVPKRDKNFQGYGRFTTGSDGAYRFRTIKPVVYPGRLAPHIHYKVSRGKQELLTSQIFIRGYADNMRDGVYRSVRDPVEREYTCGDFAPVKDSKIGEVAVKFDVVLGRTPADPEPDHHHD